MSVNMGSCSKIRLIASVIYGYRFLQKRRMKTGISWYALKSRECSTEFIMPIILLMWLAGTAAVILIYFPFTILNRLPEGYISLRPYILLLRGTILLSAVLYPAYSIITLLPFQFPIIIVISTAMKYCIM